MAVRRAFLALCQTASNPTVSCAAGQFASTCYNRGVLSTCVSECMDCPVGTYADTPGATFCRTCVPGETTAAVGGTACCEGKNGVCVGGGH